MASMKRGVGYCENTDCEDYAKGVFLLNHGDTFYCPRCRQLGKVEKERGFYRSLDAGESWKKTNSYISGGTGPHYYQELAASQRDPEQRVVRRGPVHDRLPLGLQDRIVFVA